MNREVLIATIIGEIGRQCSFGFGPNIYSCWKNTLEVKGVIDFGLVADEIIKLNVQGSDDV